MPRGTLTPTKHVPLASKAHDLKFSKRYIHGVEAHMTANLKYTCWTV